jgi:hypothetical protein
MPPLFFSVTGFIASALMLIMSPPIPANLFFRTDALRKLRSRRCDLPTVASGKALTNCFLVLIAV